MTIVLYGIETTDLDLESHEISIVKSVNDRTFLGFVCYNKEDYVKLSPSKEKGKKIYNFVNRNNINDKVVDEEICFRVIKTNQSSI